MGDVYLGLDTKLHRPVAIKFLANELADADARWRQPETGPAQPFTYVAPSRIPFVPQGYALSPDDRWLAMSLRGAGTTNIWGIPMDGGPLRQYTDFGQRPTLITRQVSWSPDGKSVYAAVVETDADVVLIDRLL